MKTLTIYLCLFFAVQAANGAIQVTSGQYLPDRLYVKTYSLTQSGSTTSSSGSYTSLFQYMFNSSYQDGSNLIFSGNTSCLYNGSLFTPGATITVGLNPPPNNLNLTENITGNGIGYLNDGLMISNIETEALTYDDAFTGPVSADDFDGEETDLSTNTDTSLPMGWENASVSAGQNISGGEETLARTAVTIIKLQTGGKETSKSRNLFSLYATATEVGPPFVQFRPIEYPDLLTMSENSNPSSVSNIAPQNIAIGSYGQSGADGNLWQVLPDNADVVVTPTVAANDYTFNLVMQKFRAFIQANNVILYPNSVAPQANFCVGQQINYSLVWSPYTPGSGIPGRPGITNSVFLWNLPGAFVNKYIPPGESNFAYAFGTYIENPGYLLGATPSCWYINSPGGTANVGVNLGFADGQQAVITTKGQFTVFRPTLLNFQSYPPFFAALVPTNSPSELQLGNSTGVGSMAYDVSVISTSPFSGTASIVQLINANRVLYFSSFNKSSTTDGEFWLDNQNPYPDTDVSISQSRYYNTIEFIDQPGYGLDYLGVSGNACSINDSFEDYIMFQPNGNNSIWVSLGQVLWSWSASTTNTNGAWSSPTYQINISSTPNTSDEISSWPNTFFNAN